MSERVPVYLHAGVRACVGEFVCASNGSSCKSVQKEPTVQENSVSVGP